MNPSLIPSIAMTMCLSVVGICSEPMAVAPAKKPVLVDLSSRLVWTPANRRTGKVIEVLNPSQISKITFLHANSNATPSVWASAIHRAITESTDFINSEPPPQEFWLQAVIETTDGKSYVIELSQSLACLTGQTFQGIFRVSK